MGTKFIHRGKSVGEKLLLLRTIDNNGCWVSSHKINDPIAHDCYMKKKYGENPVEKFLSSQIS
jgi:hypothetical protein